MTTKTTKETMTNKHKKIIVNKSYRSMKDQARYVLFQALLNLATDEQLEKTIIDKNKLEKVKTNIVSEQQN